MSDFKGARVAFLATDGVEQVELTDPWKAVQAAGGAAVLVSTGDQVQGFNHLDVADRFPVDADVAVADPRDFVALVLPGGVANPDALRMNPDAVAFVAGFATAGLPVGVICHGPWTLIEANAVKGRTLTSWPSLRTDLINAGATWVDRQVMVCSDGPGPIVSSRKPDDLPAFCKTLLDTITETAT